MTQHLSTLTEGVRQLAGGDFGTYLFGTSVMIGVRSTVGASL